MDLMQLYQESELGWALLGWYDFPVTGRLLLVGQYSAAVAAELQGVFREVEFYAQEQLYPDEYFDAILIFGGMHSRAECISFLMHRNWLRENGVLLWAADNKLGVRFLCGDVHLGLQEEYCSQQDWIEIFQAAGMKPPQFYYLMPGWHFPRNIYTDMCLPTESSMRRMEFRYVQPKQLIRKERDFLRDTIRNGVFPVFANAFLMEWHRKPEVFQNHRRASYVDMTADKGHQAVALVCYNNGFVCKKPLFSNGSVADIYEYGEQLRHRGIAVIQQEYRDGSIWMPYIAAPLLSDVLADEVRRNTGRFFFLLERWWQAILQSSEPAGGQSAFPVLSGADYGPVLANAYLDFVPTNCFFQQEQMLFFDQEYRYANYPAKFVLYRGLILLYGSHPEIEQTVSLQRIKEIYSLNPLWQDFRYVDTEIFQKKVRGYRAFHQQHYAVSRMVRRNQWLMGRLDELAAIDLFGNLGRKRLVLFGAGRYCDAYLQEYGTEYRPYCIVDNDPGKWDHSKQGIPIRNPLYLKEEAKESFRVILCSQYVREMARQLEKMGIKDYRVY